MSGKIADGTSRQLGTISNGMKNIVLLGSTGSIGQNVLNVVRSHPQKFRIIALAAGGYSECLQNQIREFKPEFVSVSDSSTLPPKVSGGIKCLAGIEGLKKLASLKSADIVFISVVGMVGIHPLAAAISSNKKVALANKESLVIAGECINQLLKLNKSAKIIPVDSEHSAIFQCLEGNKKKYINRIIITASGGALYGKKINFRKITVEEALRHPTWKMGKKITVDSATLMNKGLEVIEAHALFGIPYEKIDVLIHKQSILHSMIEFIDGSVLAQMSPADMSFAIQYAMGYPERLGTKLGRLELQKTKRLDFEKPDFSKFPCFNLAVDAGKSGGIMPAAMNAANEIAVNSFLSGKIKFGKIPEIISSTISKIKNKQKPTLDDILEADFLSRKIAEEMI